MKNFLKIFVSLAVGALCTFLVVKNMDTDAVWASLKKVSPSMVLVYVLTLAATHFFRAIRWAHLLKPIGVTLPWRQLLPISSVGFMAILALPIRLGEFVRPYYVVRSGQSRMSAVLGTVAVERIVDGLLISMVLFVTYRLSPLAFSRPVEALGGLPMESFAWMSLALFVSATIFLIAALKWKERGIRFMVRLSLLPRLAPRLAPKVEDKLGALVQGFHCLKHPAHLIPFLIQSALYWGCNGFGMWLLANAMEVQLSLTGAFAAMAFTGVVISLPNAPGLVGQFQVGIVAVVAAFLGNDAGRGPGLAYAVALHGIQTVWYLSVGLASLRFAGTGADSLGSMVRASNEAAQDAT